MSTKTLDRLQELNQALAAKNAELDEITNSLEIKDGVVYMPDDTKAAMARVQGEVKDIRNAIEAITLGREVNDYLDAPDGEPLSTGAHMPATSGKSIGELFLASEEWRNFKSTKYNIGTVVTFDGESWWDGFGAKDVWSLAAGTVSRQAFGSDLQRPIVERLPRRYHLRELFPPENTSAAVIWGIRQTGFTNNAAPVRERAAADGTSAPIGDDSDTFGKAPKSKITFQAVMYPMSEIRHVDYIHNTVLEDEPRLRGVVDRNMREGIRLAEDYQILHGDGNTPNLRGIFNTSGVQTYNQPTNGSGPTEPKTTTIRRAITRVQLAEMDPTGVVVNPLDWEDMELETDDMGRLTLVTSIAQGAEMRVWRLPVIPTTAIAQGTYLLGAFGMGAQLFERREVSVAISTENRAQFEENAVTIRATERIALTVDRPEAFVKGSLYVPA